MGQMPGKGGPSKRWCMWGQKREARNEKCQDFKNRDRILTNLETPEHV